MNLSLGRALDVTRGTLLAGDTAPPALRLTTDSRSVAPGDTFLALRGERFDGHEFAAEAVRRGAAMLVLERPESRVAGTPTMLVGETRAAYLALAGAARDLFTGRVVAITGSTGKTTTKEFLAQLLAVRYGERVLATAENENNELGVSKLILRASNDEHDVLVIEMGARHYGDVARLVEVARPGIGILTNIGEAHLEIVGSRQRLEATKWAIFSGGALPILNAADTASRRLAPSLPRSPHWFAAELPADPPKGSTLTAFDGIEHLLVDSGRQIARYAVDVRVPGLHNRANLAAAIAGAIELETSIEELLGMISRVRLPRGRYDRITAAGGIHLIYDAYNANASGMMAALDAFATESAARRIAVLASMAELGEESESLHEQVGAHAAARVDVLLVAGKYASELARGAKRGGLESRQIVFVETNTGAARWLRENARSDDVVLLKGSRRYKLEEIVEELRA
ncbi:MAG: UDP-N-acetylmuramoyl-tripeptide--D-alanyl-D-alanine ligase [Candidatus Eremiobacteraeota bacterium]|nr:UDP-N-acetylmuramoyl-tripeptide--D-alanyl-D-alanine ligase [Candidatus Eremiobacteraeota bacterium]